MSRNFGLRIPPDDEECPACGIITGCILSLAIYALAFLLFYEIGAML